MTGREIAGDLGPEWGGHFIRTGLLSMKSIKPMTFEGDD